MKNNNLVLFIKLSRPLFLLGGISQYLLGVGIAHYLGVSLDWAVMWLGMLWVLMAQLTTHYLNEFFDAPYDQENQNRTIFSGGSGVLGEGEGKLSPDVAKLAAGATMTLTATLTVLLLRRGAFTSGLVLVMMLIFLGSFFYATPPVRLTHRGYGEFTASVIVGSLVPAFGYLLQDGILPRILIIISLPLVLLLISLLISVELPDYATDLKNGKRNLLVRLGWENGMWLHNLFVLFAFLFLGIGGIIGLPHLITLPAFIPLPLGLLQVWYMRRISIGAKPNWKLLTLNAVMLFGAVSYLLTFTFWIR